MDAAIRALAANGCTHDDEAVGVARLVFEACFCLGAEAATTILEARAAEHGWLLDGMADLFDEARARVVVITHDLDRLGGAG